MNKFAIAIAGAALAGCAQMPGNPKQPFAAGSTSYQDDAERPDWLRDPARGEYPYSSKGW
jgi:hypothetical protein